MNVSTGLAQTEVPTPKKTNIIFAWLSQHHILAAFFFLLVVELCVFGFLVRSMGIYLDEWTTFNNLHFSHQTFLDLLKCVFFDPRYIIRPVSAPYFATVYYFCHENPLIYHALNQAYELAGAFFLYLALVVLLKDKALSFLAAALFLIYPSHDITHYSIGVTTTTIAVTLYTFSLWLFTLAVEHKRHALLLPSAFFFLISLLSYEICLPLFVIFIASATILLWKKHEPPKALALAVLYSTPSLVAATITILYRTLLLPSLGLGCGYRTIFDPAHFTHIISEGIKVSISPYAFSFFLNLARAYISSGVNLAHLIYLLIVAAVLITANWVFFAKATPQPLHSRSGILAIALGTLIIICAYMIFGSSPDYTPVLDTHINRVNTTSSIGAALIITGILFCLSEYLSKLIKLQQLQSIILSCLVLPVVISFILADWQFAVPWIVSWQKQQQVINIIKNRMGICSGDTIILATYPHYIMWASLFDGVWDFQAALRINLNRTDINGGVLSERMVVTPCAVEDKFENYLCARYPLKQMFLLVPSPERWISINSAPELIGWAEHYGTTVSINKMFKMPIMKPFSFNCQTVNARFQVLKRGLAQH